MQPESFLLTVKQLKALATGFALNSHFLGLEAFANSESMSSNIGWKIELRNAWNESLPHVNPRPLSKKVRDSLGGQWRAELEVHRKRLYALPTHLLPKLLLFSNHLIEPISVLPFPLNNCINQQSINMGDFNWNREFKPVLCFKILGYPLLPYILSLLQIATLKAVDTITTSFKHSFL